MPRALWLVLAAGVIVWAAAFLQVQDRRAVPAAAAAAPEPVALPERSEPIPSPARAPAVPAPTAVPVGPPAPPTAAVKPAGPSGLMGSVSATIRAARDAFVPGPKAPVRPPAPDEVATGELGEGINSPEYAALERAYTFEPRDGPWATIQERLIRFTLRRSPLQQQLAIANCQQTICRMVFERVDPDAFKQLAADPDLQKITGLSATSPFSYRAGQLSVYFPRRSAIVAPQP